MDFAACKRLRAAAQARLQAFEASLMRRETVIRFLVARLVLMLGMVLAFWIAMRHSF